MYNLENSLKMFNLFFTDTLSINNIDTIKGNVNDLEINNNDYISLYNLIKAFNKMHMAFKREYQELDKLDLGRVVEIDRFHKFNNASGEPCRLLDMNIYQPYMSGLSHTFLCLYECNGKTMPYITNDISCMSDNGYYRRKIKLNPRIVKKYLDLFESYELVLNLYRSLKKNEIYSNGLISLSTNIDSNNDLFTDDMNSFSISIKFNIDDEINITVNLGEELRINTSESYIILNDEHNALNNETGINILKNTLIRGKYLGKEFNSDIKKDASIKVKILDNNAR